MRLHLSYIFKSVKKNFDSMMINALVSKNTKFSIDLRIRLSDISKAAVILFSIVEEFWI